MNYLPRGTRVCRVLAAFCLFGLAACSSIVEGTDQAVTVTTEPPGASCSLTRQATTIAVINPTPGTVTVDKSKNDIAVNCTKEAHEPGSGVLSSKFESMTLGNVLIGGFVGLAIDASSGALNKYPASIAIILPPESFPSEPARDRYYDSLISRIEKNAEDAIAELISTCGSAESEECKEDIAIIKTKRDNEITALEAKRARAKIQTG